MQDCSKEGYTDHEGKESKYTAVSDFQEIVVINKNCMCMCRCESMLEPAAANIYMSVCINNTSVYICVIVLLKWPHKKSCQH